MDPNPKSGLQTTEFWSKVVLQVLSMMLAAYVAGHPGALTPDEQTSLMVVAGLVVPAVLELAYGLWRTLVKRAQVAAAAAAPPKAP